MWSSPGTLQGVKGDLENDDEIAKSVSVQVCLTHLMTWVESSFWLTVKSISYKVI